MKKNIKRILDKTPLITIAINSDRNIIYYNNFAKQKFLFLEEGRDINSVIRSTELNNFIEKAFVEPRTVDVHIRRLRKAINNDVKEDYIRTVRSAGYSFGS